MKTARWVGVLGITVCFGVGAPISEAKPPSQETSVESNGQRKPGGVRVIASKVNVNEASKSDLLTLTGVSAGMAQRIIAYREAHGPFKRVHDLVKVEGFSKDVIERNHGRLTVK